MHEKEVKAQAKEDYIYALESVGWHLLFRLWCGGFRVTKIIYLVVYSLFCKDI